MDDGQTEDTKVPPSIRALARRDAIVAAALMRSYSTTEEMLVAIIEAMAADRLRLHFALESGARFIGPHKVSTDIEHLPAAKLVYDKDPPHNT